MAGLGAVAVALVTVAIRCPTDPPVQIEVLDVTPSPAACVKGTYGAGVATYTITWRVNEYGTYMRLEDDAQPAGTPQREILITKSEGSVTRRVLCDPAGAASYPVYFTATAQLTAPPNDLPGCASPCLVPADKQLGPDDQDFKQARLAVVRPDRVRRTPTTTIPPILQTPGQNPTKHNP